jgi:hypothetical protein
MSGTPDEIDLAEHIAMMPKMAISTIPKGSNSCSVVKHTHGQTNFNAKWAIYIFI